MSSVPRGAPPPLPEGYGLPPGTQLARTPLVILVASCSGAIGLLVGLLVAGVLVTTSPEEERLAKELRREQTAHAETKKHVENLRTAEKEHTAQVEDLKAAAVRRGMGIGTDELVIALSAGTLPDFEITEHREDYRSCSTPNERVQLFLNGPRGDLTGATLAVGVDGGDNAGQLETFVSYVRRFLQTILPQWADADEWATKELLTIENQDTVASRSVSGLELSVSKIPVNNGAILLFHVTPQ